MNDTTLNEQIEQIAHTLDVPDIVKERGAHGGLCPACRSFLKIYPRAIHGAMANALYVLYEHQIVNPKDKYHDAPKVFEDRGMSARHTADFAKLAYFDLIEREGGVRDDGSDRTGYWRVTDRGAAYLAGQLLLKKYMLVYDGEVVGSIGEEVGIKSVKGFDFQEIMGNVDIVL